MKNLLLLAIIAFCFSSCRNSNNENTNAAEPPKALEDKSSSKILSKRSDGNLVETLYQELVHKTPELKNFESDFSRLQESQSDSIAGFNNFDAKNDNYYSSANGLVTGINDSALKTKIKLLIQNSMAKYDSSVLLHTTLISKINEKNTSLNDLHSSLKIVRTLPLMHQYQIDKKPSTKPLEGLNIEIDKVKNNAGTLLKKQ